MEQQIKIWVMWSAQWPTLEKWETNLKAQELWSWIAKTWCTLVTWACPWLPNEAAIWAKKEWWFVIWISPAFSAKEHQETYRSPYSAYDMILYTGKWLMERDITNIRSSDAIILVWWWIGTLNEFSIAYEEWKIIGVLDWTWWISNHIPEIIKITDTELEDRIIISKDPKSLVSKVILGLKELTQPKYWDQKVKESPNRRD